MIKDPVEVMVEKAVEEIQALQLTPITSFVDGLNQILPIVHRLNVEATYPNFYQRFEFRIFYELGVFIADNLGEFTKEVE